MKRSFMVLLYGLAAPLSVMAAQDLDHDAQRAEVVILNTKEIPGFLSIANGRNCLGENEGGTAVLSACVHSAEGASVETTVYYIILNSGQCLADKGRGQPDIVVCEYQDTTQQWMGLQAKGSDIRNVASNKCLSAAGQDKPVILKGCDGTPAQYWKLPH